MSEDQQLKRYVHTGEVLRPVGELRITITVDPAVVQRAIEAFDAFREASVGVAVLLSEFDRPDERNVIDQD